MNPEKIKFTKMHGLGNDFIMIDKETNPNLQLNDAFIKSICDRKYGIGCDQLIIYSSISHDVEVFNQDASKAAACGNATRCLGKLLIKGDEKIALSFGNRKVTVAGNSGVYCADMGEANYKKLAYNINPAFSLKNIYEPQSSDYINEINFVNIGNNHSIIFVPDIARFNLAKIGEIIENDPSLPARSNVSLAQITSKNHIKLATWEIGAGLTEACGTGACAAAFAAYKNSLVEASNIEVLFNTGSIIINILANNHVEMLGPTNLVFQGEYYLSH